MERQHLEVRIGVIADELRLATHRRAAIHQRVIVRQNILQRLAVAMQLRFVEEPGARRQIGRHPAVVLQVGGESGTGEGQRNQRQRNSGEHRKSPERKDERSRTAPPHQAGRAAARVTRNGQGDAKRARASGLKNGRVFCKPDPCARGITLARAGWRFHRSFPDQYPSL
jgi:hypothetical protein